MSAFCPYGLPAAKKAASITAGAAVALNLPSSAGNFALEILNGASAIAFVKFGGADVAATTADRPIGPGNTVLDFAGPGIAHFSAVLASGTGDVYAAASTVLR